MVAAQQFPRGEGLSDPERDLIVGILEVAGLALIATGYADLRSEFGRPGILAAVRAYFREFVAALRAPRPRAVMGRGSGSVGVSGTGQLMVTPGPPPTLEHRIEILEQGMSKLTGELSASATKLSGELAALRTQVETERASRERQLTEVRNLVESASIGSPGLEVLGWLWLISGILIAATPSLLSVLQSA